MVINGHFILRTLVTLVDGVYNTPLPDMLPIAIKRMQDEIYDRRLEPVPSDRELLDWARLEHPVCVAHTAADGMELEAQAAWDVYKAEVLATKNVDVGDMPEYGGLED